MRRVMFAVDDIDDVVARLRTHGAELVGELVQYEDSYRLCYVRGPEGDHRRAGRAAQLTARPDNKREERQPCNRTRSPRC